MSSPVPPVSPAPTPAQPVPSSPADRARLKRQMLALGFTLILGGLVVLAFLDRIHPALRIIIGLGDLIGGAVLLLVARQKFSK